MAALLLSFASALAMRVVRRRLAMSWIAFSAIAVASCDLDADGRRDGPSEDLPIDAGRKPTSPKPEPSTESSATSGDAASDATIDGAADAGADEDGSDGAPHDARLDDDDAHSGRHS